MELVQKQSEVARLEARRRELLRDLARIKGTQIGWSKAQKERVRLASKLRHVEDRILMLIQLRLPL